MNLSAHKRCKIPLRLFSKLRFVVLNRMPMKCCFCSGRPSANAAAAGEEMLIDTFIGAAKLTFAIFYWHSRGSGQKSILTWLWLAISCGHSRRDGASNKGYHDIRQSKRWMERTWMRVTLHRKIIIRREVKRRVVAVRIKCDNNLQIYVLARVETHWQLGWHRTLRGRVVGVVLRC